MLEILVYTILPNFSPIGSFLVKLAGGGHILPLLVLTVEK